MISGSPAPTLPSRHVRSAWRPTPRRVYGNADPALTFSSAAWAWRTATGVFTGALATRRERGEQPVCHHPRHAGRQQQLHHRPLRAPTSRSGTFDHGDGGRKTDLRQRRPGADVQVGGPGLANGDTQACYGRLARAAARAVTAVRSHHPGHAGGQQLHDEHASADPTFTQHVDQRGGRRQDEVYGNADPALTFRSAAWAWRTATPVRGGLRRRRELRANQSYAITQGTLAASGNYALNYASANLTVTQRAITVTADAEEPGLWRCQSSADLSGRRRRPRQWR